MFLLSAGGICCCRCTQYYACQVTAVLRCVPLSSPAAQTAPPQTSKQRTFMPLRRRLGRGAVCSAARVASMASMLPGSSLWHFHTLTKQALPACSTWAVCLRAPGGAACQVGAYTCWCFLSIAATHHIRSTTCRIPIPLLTGRISRFFARALGQTAPADRALGATEAAWPGLHGWATNGVECGG